MRNNSPGPRAATTLETGRQVASCIFVFSPSMNVSWATHICLIYVHTTLYHFLNSIFCINGPFIFLGHTENGSRNHSQQPALSKFNRHMKPMGVADAPALRSFRMDGFGMEKWTKDAEVDHQTVGICSMDLTDLCDKNWDLNISWSQKLAIHINSSWNFRLTAHAQPADSGWFI